LWRGHKRVTQARRAIAPPARRIKEIRKVQGLGAWYDEARAKGYKPWLTTRIAVSLVRALLPDSEPTTIITYTDGTVEVVMGGGPTSGDLALQAASLIGMGIAIGKGKLVAEIVETATDTAVQEATGSPVGPSGLRRPKGDVPKRDPELEFRRGDGPDEQLDRRRERQPESPDEPQFKYWTRSVEFEGQKVYQRDDLIDPGRRDPDRRTNLERMRSGDAPIGPDGRSLNIHHLLQTQDGPLAEMTESFHRFHRRAMHINPRTTPSGIDRREFDAWRTHYWMRRAQDFGS
jgi:hypothetical protein